MATTSTSSTSSSPSPPSSSGSASCLTPKPTAIAKAKLAIDHPQLRDLLECKHDRGVVSYLVQEGHGRNFIAEQNLLAPGAPRRILSNLTFTPSSLNALAVGPNDEDTLYAAGGSWNAELHLSYHRGGNSPGTSELLWKRDARLQGTLNNSVLLTKNHSGGVEPRLGVTNNDCTFRMYDCAVRTQGKPEPEPYDYDEDTIERPDPPPALKCVGGLTLDQCVNYAAVSPSGRTLINVGDSPNLYIHDISGSARLSFYPICVLPIPLPTNPPPHYPIERPSTFTASFCASFSADSKRFAVGSQEGVVAIWDMRYVSRPMATWQVDKMRAMGPGGMAAANGAISWDPSDWFHSRAPAWSVRNVKFVGGNRADGKEYLVFTEHTSLMHIVNAKTLEVEETVRVPGRMAPPQPPTPPMYSLEPPQSPLSYIQLEIPAREFSAGPVHFSRGSRRQRRRRGSVAWDDDDDDEYDHSDEDSMDLDDSNDRDRPSISSDNALNLNFSSDAGGAAADEEDASGTHNSTAGVRVQIPTPRRQWGSGSMAAGPSSLPIVVPYDLPSSSSHSRHASSSASSSSSRSTVTNAGQSLNSTAPSTSSQGQTSISSRYRSISGTFSRKNLTRNSRRDHRHPRDAAAASKAKSKTRRVGYTPVNRNPRYMISEGYTYPTDKVELDYRVYASDDSDRDEDFVEVEDDHEAEMAQGLDIAGVCADPSGRWLYVGTNRGVVEWGLV